MLKILANFALKADCTHNRHLTLFIDKTIFTMIKMLRYILVAAVLSVGGAMPAYASEEIHENIAPETQSTSIKTGPHCIEISVTGRDGHDVTVYALTGQVVKHLIIPEGTTRIELNPGYYIVRIDGQSKRVVVK